MKDFLNYLKSNKILFKVKDEEVCIDGKTYAIAVPTDEVFFKDSFKLDIEPFTSDYCVLSLGSEYYRVEKTLVNDPTLESMRYLGKTTETLTYSFLGIHGGFEICNGTRLYQDWVKKAKFMGTKVLGICEKNTLAGLLKFQVACEKEDIKPVLGATFTVFRDKKDLKYDIKCFVINEEGYQNLLWINTQINVINYGYVNEADLMEHGKGLQFVLDPKSLNYKDIFPLSLDFCKIYQLDSVVYEKEDEYVEYLENLRDYVHDNNLDPVSITDAYYLDEKDFYIKDKANNIHHVFEKRATNQYLKSKGEYYDELTKVFSDLDLLYAEYNLALVNEIKIADGCKFTLPLKERHLPEYEMTKGEARKYQTNQDLFWAEIKKGVASKVKKDHQTYLDRLKHEYKVIVTGGILDYFLILWDIINYCERNHILIGVGRGSAGGSLIAYLLGIIKIDPIEHGLIFERFLNPGRIKVSLPDIDIDFPSQYRDRIKHYIEKRYGLDYVCSVGTYSNLKLKSLIKDLARQKNIPAHEMDSLTAKMDDSKSSFTALLEVAVKKKEIKEFVQAHPEVIDAVPLLLNQPRSTSIHASAVIIVPKGKTVFETFPVKKMQKGKETFIVSEFEGEDLDKLGYLKEDILGITQLDKFQFVVDKHYQDTGNRIDIYNLPLDDKKVFSYFQKGWNADVFHFGSQLQQDYCKKLKPTEIGHLISANALLRPGPMDIKNKFHEKYLVNKNNPEEIEYLPGLEEITKDTEGILCLYENTNVSVNGSIKKIKDIEIGDKIINEDGEEDEVTKIINNGRRKVVKLRASFGEEIILTYNHLVLTSKGWVKAGDLENGDMIKSYWILPEKKDDSNINALEHWIIGFWIAEGSSSSSPCFTVGNMDTVRKLKKILKQFFPICKTTVIRHDNGTGGISWQVYPKFGEGCNGKFSKNYVPNQLNQLLKDYGLYGTNCYTKRLPVNYSIHMLSGIFEGDGCMGSGILRMANHDLMYDIFLALQQYKIFSNIRFEENCATINLNDDGKLFFRLGNSIKASLQKYIPISDLYFNYQSVSPVMRKRYLNYKKQFSQVISLKLLTDISGFNGYKHGLWSKVKKVEKNGTKRVYDISVKNKHSFVAGGMVFHNCYQEQIMQTCNSIGQFSLMDADHIRKAIGKGKMDLLISYESQFLEGAKSNGYDSSYSSELWQLMTKFGQYAFNKSHATAYAIMGYYCQYLKVHYPVLFWAASFKYRSEQKAHELMPRFISEIYETADVNLNPANINRSLKEINYDVENNQIYWTLDSVFFCGNSAIDQVLKHRKEDGLYKSFDDFLARNIYLNSKVNKRNIENMVLSGVFDEMMNIHRAKDRLRLIRHYREIYKVKVNGKKDWLSRCEYLDENWYFQYQQKVFSEFGFIDYESFLRYFKCDEYVSYEKLMADEYLGDDITIGGYVVNVFENECKNGVFASVIVDMNYDFLNVLIWPDIYEDLEFKGSGLKRKLIMMNGILEYDSWKNTNVLKSSEVSSVTIIN